MCMYVGGAGGNSSSNSSRVNAGGYNGGGYRYGYKGGGGATHIATASGLLKDLSSNRDAVLIVAGGGGSDGATNKQGMYGGGTTGGSSTQSYTANSSYCGKGGTQNYSGYSNSYTITTQATSGLTSNTIANYCGGFGFGGGGVYLSSGYGGAGGGGWFGGSGTVPDSSVDDDRGGGGGSGYVKSTLTDTQTIAGNTTFLAPNGTNETGHTGNGYARITITDMADLPDICPSELVPVTVTVTTAPAPVVEVPNPNACQGDNVVLTITNPVDGLNYGWWDNSSCTGAPIHEGTSFTINEMLNDATYYVRINYNGVTCSSAITEVPVELYIRPSFTLNASSSISCNNTPVEFTITDATGNILQYEWSDGTITTSTNHTVIPENTTTYIVTAYNDHCSASRQFTIAANAPNVTINGSDNDECIDAGTQVEITLHITGSLGENFAWSTGGNTSSITVSPTTTTTYTVTVSGANYACNTIVEHTVHVNPVVDISPENPMICLGTTINLTASTADGYHWNNGATTSEITVGDGTYIVTATNSDGCSVVLSTTVTEVIIPSAGEIDDIEICYSDEEISLTSNVAAIGGGTVEYRWNVGSITTGWSEATTYTLTSAERATFSPGTYNITRECRDECGYLGSAIGILTINPPINPPVVSGSTSIYCGQTATLTASSDVVGNLRYRWYSDSEGQNLVYEGSEFITPALDATTTYYVQLVDIPVADVPIDFDYTGDVQIWEVPADVSKVKLEVWGAQGGDATNGGKGGYSLGTLNVQSGDVLNVYVGGQGTVGVSGAGYNGGGNPTYSSYYGGGGATDVRINTRVRDKKKLKN